MKTVDVIGLGMGLSDLTADRRSLIGQAKVLAGGARLLALIPEHPGRRLTLSHNLEAWLEDLAQAAQASRVVVLASGDPGFYGAAAKVVKRLGADNVRIHPNVTTVQAAFARLKEPWQEAVVVSLHGRGIQALWPALAQTRRVAVFTDPAHTPAYIAGLLLERGQGDYWRMAVLEDLGSDNERLSEHSLDEAAGLSFSALNLVVLKRQAWPRRLHLGLPEEAYVHQAGLITKAEVRATALAALELAPGLTLWDLGAGCGSLGLEATLLLGGGLVVAVERDPERVQQIKANRARLGAASLEVVQADLPQGMGSLPEPQRVFVGGGGDRLAVIIEAALGRLPAGGVLVAAVVLLESLEAAKRALAAQGLSAQVTQLQISRSQPLGQGSFLKARNPVWLVKGVKPA